jgi:hypothetical protein
LVLEVRHLQDRPPPHPTQTPLCTRGGSAGRP